MNSNLNAASIDRSSSEDRSVNLYDRDRAYRLATIAQYYKNIDAGLVAQILALFSTKAVYHRGPQRHLNSKAEITAFYNNTRALIGQHEIKSIDCLGDLVVVVGRFEGTAHGQPISTLFSDFWQFGDDGLVDFRKSWIEIEGL